jgi:leucyl-tRNA synthetase
LAYQGYSFEEKKIKCLKELKGIDLIGSLVHAPYSVNEKIYILPMLSISKGTGILASVPSVSIEDYTALQDLKIEKFRNEYGVKEEWINDIKIYPIIETPEYEGFSTAQIYNDKKIKSQKDSKLLREAKELVKKRFFEGKLIYGPEKGK